MTRHPSASDHSLDSLFAKYLRRIGLLKSYGLGLSASMRCYNSWVSTVFSHAVQCEQLSRRVLRGEHLGLQRLSNELSISHTGLVTLITDSVAVRRVGIPALQ